MADVERYYGTGRRKTSTARVWIKAGDGTVMVNKRPLDDYFGREVLKMVLQQPLDVTGYRGKVDISVNVGGGGLSGQAGAILLGLTRALMKMDGETRAELKRNGHTRRDSRMVERKKPGLRGARKASQFSKR